MPQNILDVSFDLPKFDAQIQHVVEELTKGYNLMKQISTTAISPGSSGGFSELKAQTEQLNKLSTAHEGLITAQKAAAQSTAALTSTLEANVQARIRMQNTMQSYLASQKEDAELLKTGIIDRTEYNKRFAESEVKIEQYKNKISSLNKEIKTQTQTTAQQGGAYAILNKEYLLAQTNAKNLAVLYGVDSAEAKQAAAAALELNSQLQTIDKTVGQSQRNVGNYSGAFDRALGRATSLSAIAARAVSMLSRQIISLGVGMLSFEIGAKALKRLGELISTEWNKVSLAVATSIANFSNLNEVMADANKKAGEQITDLKILYETSTDVNLSMKDRLDAVKGLQAEFPAYFANQSKEAILNGESKQSYDDLTLSIIANSKAKAAKDKIDDIESKRLDAEFQKQKIMNATSNELNRARPEIGGTGQIVGGLAPGKASQGLTLTEVQSVIKNRRTLALKIQDDNIKSLQDQEDFLIKFAGLPNLAKVVEAEEKTKKGRKGAVTKESTKEALDLEFELYKINQQRKLKILDEEQNDIKRSFGDRVLLAEEYSKAEIDLAKKTAEHEIAADKVKLAELEANYKKSKGTERNNLAIEIENEKKQIKIIAAKYNDELIGIESAFQKMITQIVKDDTEQRLKIYENEKKSIENAHAELIEGIETKRNLEEASNNQLFDRKVINQKKFDELEKKSIKENNVMRAQADVAKASGLLGDALKNRDFTNPDQINKLKDDLALAQSKLALAKNDKNDPYKNKKKNALGIVDVLEDVKTGTDTAASLVDIKYEKEITAIQRIIDLNNYRKEQEMKNIQESTLSNQEKAAQMIMLDKSVAANNLKLEREKAAIAIKQAKFDRDAAVLSILENAAISYFKLVAQEGVVGIAEGIGLGILAASQIALLMAKPLPQMPQYATGTDNHPGGPAIVGEGKLKELVSTPDGKSFIADRAMLMNNLPKGSKVIPLTNDMINQAMYNSMMKETASIIQGRGNRNYDTEIIEAIENGSRMTVQAMRKQRGANVTVNVNGSWGAYITKTVKE